MLLSTMLSVVAETTSACQRCLCLGLCEQRMVHVIFCGQQANIHAKIAFRCKQTQMNKYLVADAPGNRRMQHGASEPQCQSHNRSIQFLLLFLYVIHAQPSQLIHRHRASTIVFFENKQLYVATDL